MKKRAKFDPANWRLYVITDQELPHGRSHLEIAEVAIAGGADVIQLRDKKASSRELYEAALAIRKLTEAHGIPFIINDRLDIALAVDADGVHVGQEDLPARVVRRVIGSHKILGVSAGSLEEARGCEEFADYLGVGPVFEARRTKVDAGEPRGISLIREIKQSCRLPIIAIGGIKPKNAAQVIHAGANGVAVISAIAAVEDVKSAAQQFKKILTSRNPK